MAGAVDDAGDPTMRSGLAGVLGLVGAGLVMAAAGVAGLARFTDPGWPAAVAGVSVALGLGLAAVGLLFGLFKVVTHRSVEWFLAWRYLRSQDKGKRTTLVVGLGFIGLAGLLLLLSIFWREALGLLGVVPRQSLSGAVPTAVRVIQAAALVAALLGYLVTFFGVLLRAFSLFTSISVFGVFLGTAALIIVLSVMGGFESDLRAKILGTIAHVVVDKPAKMFGGYKEALATINGVEGVVAASPYLESEVMVTSPTNLSGVLLRGIDPASVGKVTRLEQYLKAEEGAGRLELLQHPERLAKIPQTRFKPMVSDPLGEAPPGVSEEESGEPDPPGEGVDPGTGSSPDRAGSDEDGAGSSPDEGGSDPDAAGAGEGSRMTPRPVYPGIIIGAELAKNLRLYVGDDVNVIAPLGGMSPMGPIPKSKPFRVAGIFYSGMYEYDTKFAYITIPAAQRFLGLDDVVSGVEIKAGSMELATPLAARLAERLKGKGFRVRDWKQINRNLFSALKLERVVMFIVLIFIVLVASFSIITTLIMVVLEKRREIAALKSMGATDSSVLKIFLYTGLYIGTIGMLVGLFSAVGFCLFLAYVGLPLDPEVYYISELPVEMDPRDITLVALAGVTISFLATIYPAMLAARLKPVDGLRRYVG